MSFVPLQTIYEISDDELELETVRSASPAPTLETLSSSIYEDLFDLKHGRRVNATCQTYSMAADEHEIVRMDQEHQLYKLLFRHQYGDDLFCAPDVVQSALLASDQPRVYDLGTGTGAWAIDMANRFPNAEVVGVDVVPLQPSSDTLPPNCRMEVDNLNLPLYHRSPPPTLIHVRLLSSGITDYPALIDDCARALTPGGLLHLLETDFRAYSAPYALNTDTSASPSVRWLRAVVAAMRNKRANVDAAANLRRWVAEHGLLEEVEYHDEWLPLFPMYTPEQKDAQFLNEIARRTQRDFLAYLENARPLLLDLKNSPTELGELERLVRDECARPRMQVFIRVCVIAARKVLM